MRKVLKWIGIILGVVIGIGVIALIVTYFIVQQQFNRAFDIEVTSIDVAVNEETIAEGTRLYQTLVCFLCHGPDGRGGLPDGFHIDIPLVASFSAPNLTAGAGGVGANYQTADDWLRALRHGVKPNGISVVLMPSDIFGRISDEDMAALIAYLQSLEPVDSEPQARSLGPLVGVFLLFNPTGEALAMAENIDHDNIDVWDVDTGASAEYGEYQAYIHCTICHGENLSGSPGEGPEAIPVPNITPGEDGIGHYTFEDFQQAVQRGVRPDGSDIDPQMPWGRLNLLTDEEVEAIWLYLQSLEPLPDNTAG